MKTLHFSLGIPEAELLKLYSGEARIVSVTDNMGRTLQFPAGALRPFIVPGGVYGRFVMQTDDNYKLIKLEREGDL